MLSKGIYSGNIGLEQGLSKKLDLHVSGMKHKICALSGVTTNYIVYLITIIGTDQACFEAPKTDTK